MGLVKCACGCPECKIKIKIGTLDGTINLWFTDKDGKETLMYLDANTAIKLIHELKEAVNELMR